jgi:hypothetical protein
MSRMQTLQKVIKSACKQINTSKSRLHTHRDLPLTSIHPHKIEHPPRSSLQAPRASSDHPSISVPQHHSITASCPFISPTKLYCNQSTRLQLSTNQPHHTSHCVPLRTQTTHPPISSQRPHHRLVSQCSVSEASNRRLYHRNSA